MSFLIYDPNDTTDNPEDPFFPLSETIGLSPTAVAFFNAREATGAVMGTSPEEIQSNKFAISDFIYYIEGSGILAKSLDMYLGIGVSTPAGARVKIKSNGAFGAGIAGITTHDPLMGLYGGTANNTIGVTRADLATSDHHACLWFENGGAATAITMLGQTTGDSQIRILRSTTGGALVVRTTGAEHNLGYSTDGYDGFIGLSRNSPSGYLVLDKDMAAPLELAHAAEDATSSPAITAMQGSPRIAFYSVGAGLTAAQLLGLRQALVALKSNLNWT